MKSAAIVFVLAGALVTCFGGASADRRSRAPTPSTPTSRRRRPRRARITRASSPRCARPANIQPPATPQRGQRAAGAGATPPGPPDRFDVARGTGQGVRQPVLRRHDRVLRVGGQDIGRHHPARHDLRLLDRGRSGGRPEEAGTRPGHHQIRAGQPRPHRPFRRREVPAGALRHQGPDVGRRLGADCRLAESEQADARPWSSAMGRS